MRTFISLNIESSAKGKIQSVKDQIAEKILTSDPEQYINLKWEDEKNYHITLFFIGDTDKVKLKQIESALSEIRIDSIPLQMKLMTGKTNAFPNLRFPRVLILDVKDQSSGLNILSKEINKCMLNFGFKTDKTFHPHITLARVRRDRKVNLTSLGNTVTTTVEFSTDRFSLMESRLSSSGAEHKLIRDFNFRDPEINLL